MPPGALIHGWPGLLGAYATVQGSLLAGMVRARAPWRRLLMAPVIAAPLTVASGLGCALLTPALSGLGIGSASLLQLSAALGLTAALGYLSGRAYGGASAAPVVRVRGAIVAAAPATRVRGTGAHGAVRTHGRAPAALTLAGVPLDAADETKHFKLIGTTGTGKSTAIRELLGAALARGDRAVIADPDGGYLGHFHDAARGDVILNPFERASVRWDLFAELTEAHDVEQLARSLIPDHEGPERSWRGYARTFFSAVTDQARVAGVSDVRELYRLLVVAGTSELRTLVAGTPAQPFLEEHNGRMFDSIRSVTSSAVAALAYVARQEHGAAFSVRRWVRDAAAAEQGTQGRGVLFIPYRAGQIAALRSVISAWM
ncbi:MAG TPA: type IV secretion system DNA-binding domain-containing protein [Steroidobacteraceae bacterium]